MADEIKKIGANVTLREGGKGVFDVKKDGSLIFSKFKIGRFPKTGEITELLKKN